MKTQTYLILASICFIFGLLLFAVHREWIIIQIPQTKDALAIKTNTHKKSCSLSYWHDNKWHTETSNVIWSDNRIENLSVLIGQWLTIMHEEKIIKKKVVLESVAESASFELFLSFDRSLINKESSTHEKLMVIESLLKTIRDNEPLIKNVRIMVQHQPLADYHLDFTNPWPIQGFIS